MAFTIYKSTDAGAPVLTGESGTLTAMLYACLVTGYGALAGAGWTRAYNGASKSAFQQGAGSSGFLVRVQDDGPGAGTFKEARVTGYEAMTDVDTGTNPFPTAALGVGGTAMLVVRKSAAASAVARAWIVVADARTFYVMIFTGDTAGVFYSWMFGDFTSYVVGDAYACILQARSSENSAVVTVEYLGNIYEISGSSRMICARSHSGIAGAVGLVLIGDRGVISGGSGSSYPNAGLLSYPNPADGGLYLSRLRLGDKTTGPANTMRGTMRGYWHFMHPAASISHEDTFSGTGDLAGRTFVGFKPGGSVNYGTLGDSVFVFETSDTLDT